jgi:hypothetical protein
MRAVGIGGADNPVPWPLLEYRLCQKYACTPSELHAQNPAVIYQHLIVMGGIEAARRLKGKKRNGK